MDQFFKNSYLLHFLFYFSHKLMENSKLFGGDVPDFIVEPVFLHGMSLKLRESLSYLNCILIKSHFVQPGTLKKATTDSYHFWPGGKVPYVMGSLIGNFLQLHTVQSNYSNCIKFTSPR